MSVCTGGRLRYQHWLDGYIRRWVYAYGVINIIFNRLLSTLDTHGLVDWSATALDGSNIRALRCAAGAQKNIPISQEITAWVALAVVLAPKSIWLQTEWSAVKHRSESRSGSRKPVCTTSSGRYWSSAPERQYEAPWSCCTG